MLFPDLSALQVVLYPEMVLVMLMVAALAFKADIDTIIITAAPIAAILLLSFIMKPSFIIIIRSS